MFRRLHLDEAHRASHVRAPAKEGENQENPEQSELAIEFSRLLDQVQGPVAAIHDEVMALGLALAQAIPTLQQNRQDIEQHDAFDDAQQRSFGDDTGSDQDGAYDDDREDASQRLGSVLDNSGTAPSVQKRTAQNASDEQAVSQSSSDENDSDAEPSKVGIQLDFSVLENTEEEDLSTCLEVDSSEAETVEVVSHVPTALSDQIKVEVTNKTAESTADNLGNKEILAELKSLGADDESQSESSDESGEDEADFTSTAEVLSRADNVQDTKTRKAGEMQSHGQSESQHAEGETTASSTQGESPTKQDARGVRPSLVNEPSGQEHRLSQKAESNSKIAAPPKLEHSQMPEHLTGEIGKLPSSALDSGIQLTLLRQAFEAFRVQRSDGNDSKQRAAMPQISSVSVASEARAASAETGARGSKQLNRATAHRMLERVEATLKEAARSRDGKTISVRLDPAQLGRVKVDVSLREGALHARITPENREVLVSLREHAHELQGALRKLGLNVDSVSVTVTSEGGNDTSEFGRQLNDGKSYQEDRNNMPHEPRQPIENTFGNELAEVSTAGAPQGSSVARDHWVA